MPGRRVVANARLNNAEESRHEAELKNIAYLNHDLNNNLHAISLQLKVIRQRLAPMRELCEELEFLDRAQDAIAHTTEGMRRLLTYSKLRKRQAPLHLRPIRLLDVATMMATQNFLGARIKGLSVDVDVPAEAVVEGDLDLLVLVLQNVVGNSIKYSKNGCVKLSARRDERGRWTMFVSDEGPGIPQHQLERIFERFERADVNEQGVGLGLSIASEAARVLGAELSVTSEVGVGSTFGLTLNPSARVGVSLAEDFPGLKQYVVPKGEAGSDVKGSKSWRCH